MSDDKKIKFTRAEYETFKLLAVYITSIQYPDLSFTGTRNRNTVYEFVAELSYYGTNSIRNKFLSSNSHVFQIENFNGFCAGFLETYHKYSDNKREIKVTRYNAFVKWVKGI